MILRDSNEEAIMEELFSFRHDSSNKNLRFFTNLEKSALFFQDSAKSLFKISEKGTKSSSVTFDHPALDIQITSSRIYVFLSSGVSERPQFETYKDSSEYLVEVYDLDLQFLTTLKPNWSHSLLTRVFSVDSDEFVFKVENSDEGKQLRVYQLVENWELILKRKQKLSSQEVDVKGFYLIKELDKELVFLYHVDNKLQLMTLGKQYFFFKKLNDYIRLPDINNVSSSNGVWAWGKNQINFLSPVYSLIASAPL